MEGKMSYNQSPQKANRSLLHKLEPVIIGLLIIATFGTAVWIGRTDDNPYTHLRSQARFGEPGSNSSNSYNNGSPVSGLPMISFAPIVKAALPAVVSVSASKTVKVDDADLPFFNDPFFRHFFGGQNPNGKPHVERERGLGSGVIISADGLIITNDHVVEGASDIKVYLSDNHALEARVVGGDPNTDIAVIKVDEKGLPTMPLADSSKVEAGDLVLAIGNPFGVGKTVTMGIVSATGRGNLGIEDYEDFIQTDAAINPGNSGGALINMRGQLVGINTAILSNGAMGNQGVGFAVPANMARTVMDQILKNGKVVRGYLGVMIQEVTPAVAKAFKLDQAGGALISDVTDDGPAARAGLVKGDIILEFNGEQVTSSRELRLKISQMAPGSPIRLKLFRDGKEREMTVKLGELPNEEKRASNDRESGGTLEGLTVDTLTPEIARELNLPANTRGVVVIEAQDGSAAAGAGLRRGDVIQEVNRNTVNSAPEFARMIKQAGNQSVLLLVNRSGHTSFLIVEAGF
jgi:serine protease Do